MSQFNLLHDLLINQKPESSDVVVWLQGDRFDRAQKTLELFQQGWAPKILISGNDILIGEGKRSGETNVSLAEMRAWLSDNGVNESDIIADDGAMNTKDQAEHILRMAKDNNWKKIILVGSSFYQPRAFLTFLKEAVRINFTGKLINQPAVLAPEDVPSGRTKKASELSEEEAAKIKKYKSDVAPLEEGIKYISKETL